ncbi:MAG: protein kinase domain-containing protein [Solirubrobacteraceae bacterium]
MKQPAQSKGWPPERGNALSMHDSGSPTLADTTWQAPPAAPGAVAARDDPTATAVMDATAGTNGVPVLGRYRLTRRLGAGAFGTVWLARDERLERDVAIKLLPRERIASGRFEREARAAARLHHPGIVILYEAVVDDDGGYLVSELVRGRTFDHLLRDGRLSDRDILAAGVALCDALEYAHRQGVVHRDVKPSNVLVPDSPSTAAEVAKLTDFGVARVIGGDALTRTGDVVGTTAYMAPEQAEGREAHASADLYSLGLVIYEGLTGVNPLRLGRHSGRARRLGTYLPAVRRYRRDLPRDLACGIDLVLRPRPRERGTVLELRSALISAIDQVEDCPGTAAPHQVSRTRAEEHELQAFARREDPARAPPGQEVAGSPGVVAAVGVPVEPGPGLAGGWTWRAAAAGAAALATAWFASAVLSSEPVYPALVMVGVGLLVALLPRIGWMTLVFAGTLLLVGEDKLGGAVLLLAASLPPVLLLIGRPTRWPLPALVPALALVGLPGLWPALAGRAPTAWQRVVLGMAGWSWLVIGGLLGAGADYVRVPAGASAPRLWIASLSDAPHQVLHPLLHSGLLLPGLVWAVGAMVLPAVIGGPGLGGPRSVTARAGSVLLWSACVTIATYGVLAAVAPGATLRLAPALAGALACAVAGMLPGVVRRGRPSGGWSDARAGLA